jgi:hypothetical protein
MAHHIALKVVLICALVLAASAVLAASPAHYPRVSTICPGPSSPVDGVPAIRPSNDCTPSFTEQDARSYLAANLEFALVDLQSGLPKGVTFVDRPQIVSIRFLSTRDLNLSRDPDAPAWQLSDRVVCYVALHGAFFPIHVPSSLRHLIFHSVYIVFDAHSGNVLGTGPLSGELSDLLS